MGVFIYRNDVVKLDSVDNFRHIAGELAKGTGSVFFLVVDGNIFCVFALAFKFVFAFEYDGEKNLACVFFQSKYVGKFDRVEVKLGKLVNRERFAVFVVKDRGERVVVVGFDPQNVCYLDIVDKGFVKLVDGNGYFDGVAVCVRAVLKENGVHGVGCVVRRFA